jgi:hypothetical protein
MPRDYKIDEVVEVLEIQKGMEGVNAADVDKAEGLLKQMRKYPEFFGKYFDQYERGIASVREHQDWCGGNRVRRPISV